MLPYQERVIEEKAVLESKINLLRSFIGNHVFVTLPENERTLLMKQLHRMKQYEEILAERIEGFKYAH